MAIRIDTFHGIAPRQHPTQLADGMAITAHNVKLKTGKIVPLREPKAVSGIQIRFENGLKEIKNARSMYCWKHTNVNGSTWIEFILFPGVVWFSEGNVADDEYERVFISGETGISWSETVNNQTVTHENVPCCYFYRRSANAISRMSLCKKPPNAPSVQRAASSPTLDTAKIRYTRFFATWVDEFGYESGLSDPSVLTGVQDNDAELEYNDGDSITFAADTSIPNGADKVRYYKILAGTDEKTDGVQFVAEVDAQTARTSHSLKVADEACGETAPNFESPTPGLQCIVKVPGSFYCGFDKSFPKSVMFSDINYPAHWPIGYRYDVTDNIVSLASTSGMIVVLTDGYPYVLTGTVPESMTVAKLAGPAACVSPLGVCVYRNAVYYVSNIGICVVYNDADAGTVCTNITDKIFTKDQWQALNPASCIMGQFDGALHLFFTKTDGTKVGYSIDLSENVDAVTTHDEVATCLCTDNRTDKMYFVRKKEA